ncbi:hypothetical protein [Streptomyces sp. NPDC086989]|uniref:hypothetical protein n=1 Tax=Streptomyces sp. NPDC086989 TaxID=3365764 RepID=UPI0037FBCA2B
MLPMVLPRTGPAPVLRGRIGAGFSPVPHRYRLYLSADCPGSVRVAAALARLGLEGAVATTLLGPPATYAALRRAYEAAGHHYDGALAVPALCDTWSGRVIGNDTEDILDDLRRLQAHPAFRADA